WALGSRLDPDVAVGAGLVLNDDLLMQAARQALTDEARRHVGRAAGRKRHDEANRAARPLLRRHACRNDGKESQQANGQLHHWKMTPRFLRVVSYRSFSPPATSSAAIEVSHAVLEISARAHALHPAHAARAVCRRLLRRTDLDLYRRHVRHR